MDVWVPHEVTFSAVNLRSIWWLELDHLRHSQKPMTRKALLSVWWDSMLWTSPVWPNTKVRQVTRNDWNQSIGRESFSTKTAPDHTRPWWRTRSFASLVGRLLCILLIARIRPAGIVIYPDRSTVGIWPHDDPLAQDLSKKNGLYIKWLPMVF